MHASTYIYMSDIELYGGRFGFISILDEQANIILG